MYIYASVDADRDDTDVCADITGVCVDITDVCVDIQMCTQSYRYTCRHTDVRIDKQTEVQVYMQIEMIQMCV